MRVLTRIWHFSRRNCLARKGSAIEHTLTFQQMVDIWHAQKGQCYYLNIPMVLLTAADWKCSLERKDPAQGYTMENCVLCCHEMNGSCQWSSEKVRKFKELLLCPDSTEFELTDDVYRCVSKIFNTATGNARRRKGSVERSEFNITREDLVDILVWQDGRCHYSGMRMTFETNQDWKASLERLNPLKGYVVGNVVFICWEFNTFDNTSRIVYSNGGSCNWSKEKMDMVRKSLVAQSDRAPAF